MWVSQYHLAGGQLFQQIVVAVFILFGTAFACIGLCASWLLSPTNPTEEKGITFESGVDPIGDPWIRFRPGYFVYAILFVIFDVEVVFLYPWAVALGSSAVGWFFILEMFIFVAILLGGLEYAQREGALTWH
jgi:NADH-quinone oxidoreductase subunit A